ncbi:MAG: T9SS C-terminal target domain-containing protein [Bacteroidetes bacterium]|nr:MAG: T9SS C-terminal target domain-containing protein [Bacteroidota bacterium]
MSRIVLFSLLFCLSVRGFSQSDLAIGQWKSHLPFNAGLYVTQSETQVFYATRLALLAIDKADLALHRMTKVEGLSQVGISLIKYNQGAQKLMVIYDDSTIDLVSEDEIFTIFDLKNSNIINGKKEVYDIFIENDSIAWLGANYGITKFNMRSGQSPLTTKFPVPVQAVTVKDRVIYAGTDEGIYFADLDHNPNINDFNNWGFLGTNAGFPADYHTLTMTVFNGDIYAEVNDTLCRYDGQKLEKIHYEPFDDASSWITYLTSEGKKLLMGVRPRADKAGKVLCFDQNLQKTELDGACVSRPRYGIEDQQGRMWLAEAQEIRRDFRMIQPDGTCRKIEVNSPYSSKIREIVVQNGEVWIASGGITESAQPLKNPDGFFSLIDGQWSVHNKFNTPINVDDYYTIRVHPENGKVYAGTYDKGLVVYDRTDQSHTLYTIGNSPFQSGALTPDVRIGGLAFDDQNNLWISNNIADIPLHLWKNDGSWQSFNPPCNTEKDFMDIRIDFFGYKWIRLNSDVNKGILVFYEGDLDDPSDDECTVISSANSNLPSNRVNDIAVDLDGSVWVGTETGAVVFECDVLHSDCPGSLRIGELDEFGAYLLEDQNIQTIAVDGANRKWFGTLNGIFVMSPSGEEQVASFTTENSPLFDNLVVSIAFDYETGEAYIGTAKGLQVLRTEATLGGPVHQPEVLVFPNPVRPDYTGLIAIKGLAQDADVKITDVNGTLVYQTTALGGQAIWDGRDYNGRRANSGVYLVFSTNDNASNPEAVVAKILFMN